MQEQFIEKDFTEGTLAIINLCIDIIDEYMPQGLKLTLRQLYYQLVARGHIENNIRSYNRIKSIVTDARMAGMIDWSAIEDRTRNLVRLSTWDSPSDIVYACSSQFRIDRWGDQPYRPEVWIEKDALVGVIEGVCNKWRVPFFSCRGYTSISEMYSAAKRLSSYIDSDQKPVIIHLGDHDPSGIDMTRDIFDRLETFTRGEGIHVSRIALNMPQIDRFNPPPNPVKLQDSRATGYIRENGTNESWELDALDPSTMASLIEEAILKYLDQDAWSDSEQEETDGREALRKAADQLCK